MNHKVFFFTKASSLFHTFKPPSSRSCDTELRLSFHIFGGLPGDRLHAGLLSLTTFASLLCPIRDTFVPEFSPYSNPSHYVLSSAFYPNFTAPLISQCLSTLSGVNKLYLLYYTSKLTTEILSSFHFRFLRQHLVFHRLLRRRKEISDTKEWLLGSILAGIIFYLNEIIQLLRLICLSQLKTLV